MIQHFYPRSPCGERLEALVQNAANYVFLSTLSLRRATHCGRGGKRQPTISIHALLAESDSKSAQNSRGTFAHMKQILWELHLHADRQGCILPFLPLFFPYFLVRRNREFYDRLPLALSKQDSILIKIRVQPHMLDFAFVMVSQLIKAQAVRF